jgi:hypothetical protein
MSTETLSNLRDYLFGTLSRSNMLWLATQLKEHAEKQEELKPYTMEELNARIDESERQLANGQYKTIEEVFHEMGHKTRAQGTSWICEVIL